MKTLITRHRLLAPEPLEMSLQSELGATGGVTLTLSAKVFGVQDLVTIAGDNHGALVRLKLAKLPLNTVIEMAEAGS